MMKQDNSRIPQEKVAAPKSMLSNRIYTEEDEMETKYLMDTFVKDQFFDDNNNTNTNEKSSKVNSITFYNDIVQKLSAIISNWIILVATKCGMNETIARSQKAFLLTFGSHKLGVNWINGDVDSLVLSPQYVDREKHFFGDLADILRKDPNIEELLAIKDAYVPVMKMKYYKVSFDLLFARIDAKNFRDDGMETLNDDNLLVNLDPEMIRSLNGCRVADKLLELIENKDSFRGTLKLVKLWARNKGIYSNITGFLGGVSWAILVAKLCQLFPFFKPNKLLVQFFKFYSQWNWNEYPVLIEEIKTDHHLNRFVQEKQWSEHEKTAMNIITPAFPCKNSSYSVSQTALNSIVYHLKEAWISINNDIEYSPNGTINWDPIFEKYNFYKNFRHFFEVKIAAEDSESFVVWKSFVESKLKYFTKSFEYFDQDKKFEIRPYPIPCDTGKYEITYYFGLKLKQDYFMPIQWNFWHVAREFLDQLIYPNRRKGTTLKIQTILRENLPETVYKQIEDNKSNNSDESGNGNSNSTPQVGMDNTIDDTTTNYTKVMNDFIMGKSVPFVMPTNHHTNSADMQWKSQPPPIYMSMATNQNNNHSNATYDNNNGYSKSGTDQKFK
jgi:poly(A) polymerase